MGFLGTLAALAAIGSIPATAFQTRRLDVIDLPIGYFPEGIALAEEWTVFVGSFIDGSIWQGDLSTGEGRVVLQGTEGPLLGLNYDRRSGLLFASGAFTGTARIYDTKSPDFDLVANVTLVGNGESGVVNDVIVTDTAAYFTDSLQAQIYKVPLDPNSGYLKNGSETTAETIPLTGFPIITEGVENSGTVGVLNANGIEANEDGTLITVNMATGELYAIDPATGQASLIDLGGALLFGDGLVLRKNTLWVVENTFQGPNRRISEVSLSQDLSCGTVVRTFMDDVLDDQPATAVRKGNSLYVIIFRNTTPFEDIPNTPYEIYRVDRDGDAVVDMCLEAS